MIKAVLLDLDNTLLLNPDHQFAIAFLKALDAHFYLQLSIETISPVFRQGIQLFSQNRDLIQTNTGLMVQLMAEETNATTEQVQQTLHAFYEDVYPDLKQHTSPVPVGKQLIERLLEQDIAVAIATNPLYSEVAIFQRLQWAGLDAYMEQFAFITHADNMHFAKPHPGYYAEVIARIGIEPDEAIMVGDSLKNDIHPAESIGIPTFHVTPENPLDHINEHVQQSGWQNRYLQVPLQPHMIIPQYEGNIGALFGLLSGVQDHQWQQRPDPKEWSILQILSHLQVSETETQRERLLTILEKDNPFIVAPPPPGLDIPICHPDGNIIANQFRLNRLKTIERLETLSLEQWQRPARHSIFGMTTLLEMAYFTAQHDRLHINQLCQTLGNCD